MKVMVAMSGGVDSSVAALLLREQGFEVVGVTMCLGVASPDAPASVCCSPQAVADAARVCRMLDMRHYVFDFAPQLKETVIDNFISEYEAGRTPNPCVRCNELLKFDILLKKARGLGFDALATGHYARIDRRGAGWYLCRPADVVKDQTYFLYCIRKENLPHIVFPLADLTKPQVRERAAQARLPVAHKQESQDVCFIPDGNYAAFLSRELPLRSGAIVDVDGKQIGTHQGIHHFTIGQRKGLGALGRPMYVKAIDPRTQTVVAATDDQLMSSGVVVEDLKTGYSVLEQGMTCRVQVRYRSKAVGCQIVQCAANRIILHFDEPVRAIAAGQAAVLYQDDTVLAGGTIVAALE